jgi:hypothetical protein
MDHRGRTVSVDKKCSTDDACSSQVGCRQAGNQTVSRCLSLHTTDPSDFQFFLLLYTQKMRPDLRGMLRRGLLQRGNGSQREQRHLPADAYGRLLSCRSRRPWIRCVPFHLDPVIHLVDVAAAVIKVAHRRPSAASTNNKRENDSCPRPPLWPSKHISPLKLSSKFH